MDFVFPDAWGDDPDELGELVHVEAASLVLVEVVEDVGEVELVGFDDFLEVGDDLG